MGSENTCQRSREARLSYRRDVSDIARSRPRPRPWPRKGRAEGVTADIGNSGNQTTFVQTRPNFAESTPYSFASSHLHSSSPPLPPHSSSPPPPPLLPSPPYSRSMHSISAGLPEAVGGGVPTATLGIPRSSGSSFFGFGTALPSASSSSERSTSTSFFFSSASFSFLILSASSSFGTGFHEPSWFRMISFSSS